MTPWPITHAPEEDPPVVELWLIFKLSLLGYVLLALQCSVMGRLQTHWCHLDLIPLATALVGFRLGMVSGAVFGTVLACVGVMLMGEPTGLPVLACMAVGVLAGRLRTDFRVESRAVRLSAVIALLVIAEAIQWMGGAMIFGIDPVFQPLAFVVAVPAAFLLSGVTDWLLSEG